MTLRWKGPHKERLKSSECQCLLFLGLSEEQSAPSSPWPLLPILIRTLQPVALAASVCMSTLDTLLSVHPFTHDRKLPHPKPSL